MERARQKEYRAQVPEIKLTTTSVLLQCSCRCTFAASSFCHRDAVLSPKRAMSTCNNELGTTAERPTDKRSETIRATIIRLGKNSFIVFTPTRGDTTTMWVCVCVCPRGQEWMCTFIKSVMQMCVSWAFRLTKCQQARMDATHGAQPQTRAWRETRLHEGWRQVFEWCVGEAVIAATVIHKSYQTTQAVNKWVNEWVDVDKTHEEITKQLYV